MDLSCLVTPCLLIIFQEFYLHHNKLPAFYLVSAPKRRFYYVVPSYIVNILTIIILKIKLLKILVLKYNKIKTKSNHFWENKIIPKLHKGYWLKKHLPSELRRNVLSFWRGSFNLVKHFHKFCEPPHQLLHLGFYGN